jgi:hypothetical protein
MKMPNLFVNAVATWDGKALTKGQKQIQGFEKGVKNLAKAFGVGLGAAAIVQFGKASAKAFAEDEVAANRLTTAVKNLGLGFEDERIKNFVATVEAQSGVLDDKLRPALQSILTTTGSVAKSQELLKLAIDVAAGSGEDLTTVATDLSQAYVGNTKGLKKYYLGLTQTELKAASFNDIQTALNKQFSGSNAAYLNTYAGQMNALNVSFANMQETIGKGLLDSFALLAGDGGIGAATTAMDNFATKTSDAIFGVATLLNKLNTQFGTFGDRTIGEILYASLGGGFIDALAKIGNDAKIKPKPFTTPMTISGQSGTDTQVAKQRAVAEAAAVKRAKELAALQKKAAKLATAKLAADKKAAADQAKLSKAQSIFNMEQIQIEAALKGKISENERLRLELQRAILNEDYDLAAKLQKELETSQRAIGALQGQLNDIKPPPNPFEVWLKSLDDVAETLKKIYASDSGTIRPFVSKDTSDMTTDQYVDYVQEVADAATDAAKEAEKTVTYSGALASALSTQAALAKGLLNATNGNLLYSGLGDMTDFISTGGQSAFSAGNSVTVNVQGSVLDGNDFVDIVTNALLDGQRQGRSQSPAGSIPIK